MSPDDARKPLRRVVQSHKFVDVRGRGHGYQLKTQYKLTLDCGHQVTRDVDQKSAKCPKGC